MNFLPELPKQRIVKVNIENVTAELLTELSPESDEKLASFTQHEHEYAELFACLSGNITLNTQNGKATLNAGDCAVIPPRVRHVLDPLSTGRFAVAGIILEKKYTRGCFDAYSILSVWVKGGEIRYIRNCPELCKYAEALLNTSAYLPAAKLLLLLAEESEKAAAQGSALINFPGGNLDRISRLDYLINSCFMCELTEKSAAESLCVSTRQLMRIVKKQYGSTFKQVLSEKRLSVAAKLLTETDKSVSEICFEVGFGSLSVFYAAFSKKFGTSPGRYR